MGVGRFHQKTQFSVIIVVNIVNVSHYPQTHYVAKNSLELVVILLTQPTKCWDHRCEPQYQDIPLSVESSMTVVNYKNVLLALNLLRLGILNILTTYKKAN